ncbi:MAG: HlyD family efflux transporter periplasmic adaptor subunit [Phycisphaerales bacterium]|nr:MAG: HlyD family efflux transporter periplasmic adaptor subunit [Phycisphaerales bacterium]
MFSSSNAHARPSRPNTRRRGAALAYAASGVVALCVVGWVGWTVVSRAAAVEPKVTAHRVERRSFSVILKEKGELRAVESTDIKSDVEGRATIISLIPEGTAVKEGDLLVELASNEIEDKIRAEELKEASSEATYRAAATELDIQRDQNASDIRKAELKVELARLAYDQYVKGDWEQRLRDADIAIEQARITLERRQEDLTASQELFDLKYITETKYKEDEFNFKRAAWELEKAQLAKVVLEEYTHKTTLREKESDLDEAIKELERVRKSAQAEEEKKAAALASREKELNLTRDKLANLREQRSKCRIIAPGPGLVVYYGGGGGRMFMGSDEQIKEGATVFERQTLITLVNTTRMKVVANVHESKTDKIAIEQPATVQVEGIPGQLFRGRVSKIGVLAESQNRWINPDLKQYEIEIELEPAETELKPGVTAVAEILVKNVADVTAVPVQAVFSKNGHSFVFLASRTEAAPVEVKTGIASTQWVELTEGLSPGVDVLLAVSDHHLRLLPDLPPVGPQVNGPQFDPEQPMRMRPAVTAERGGAGEPGAKVTFGRGERPAGAPGQRPAGGPGQRPSSGGAHGPARGGESQQP